MSLAIEHFKAGIIQNQKEKPFHLLCSFSLKTHILNSYSILYISEFGVEQDLVP